MNDNLHITPASRDIDVDQIRAWLDARPDTFELAPNVYRIADSPAHADLLYGKALEGKSSSGTFVRIEPRAILVENEGGIASLRSVLDFIKWLQTEYELRFGAGWSGERDITEELRERGVEHHYSEQVRSFELAWPKQLREIGFFRDLSYGRDTSITLEQAHRDAPGPDEGELAAYLESGALYRAGDVLATNTAGDVLGPADVLTDGLYIWPAQLAEQVRHYHVRLPRHFRIHARSNGWRVPAVDLATLPGSENISPPTPGEVARYSRPTIPPLVEGETCSLFVAHGLATTGPLLRSGAADAVYRGFTRRGTRVLVTFTMRHDDSYDELAERLRFEHDGIAKLLHVGRVDPASGRGFIDELVELEPPGRSILECAPIPEAAAIRCGIEIATILESFHERLVTLGGLAPELIYIDEELRFTEFTPRSRRFVASVNLQSGGLRSYKLPYSGYEVLVLGRSGDEQDDIFALCASLFHAVTGTHPFGSTLPETIQRITTNQPLAYPGSPAFGALLASGLDPDPDKRPSASDLASAFARLT